ncbi:MAG: tetratricopeptide repeat protein, partial [Candidatus Gastranaerophilales bacterium]|nr:tetratricopeptide repeat protein [Candidatus Gastranaerophilales bacterium]
LEKAYKIFPKNQEILKMYSAANSSVTEEKNNVALSYLNEGDYQKALAAYQQVAPKTSATYESIANCYRQLGDLKNAVLNYKKGIELSPDDTELYYALGVTYLESNELQKAKEAFSKSVEKDTHNIKSKKMLSYLEQKDIVKSIDLAYGFYEKGDYASALKYLDKAAEVYPLDAKIYYYRGLTKEALNDNKGAVSDYRKTVETDRNYVVAYFKLAQALEKINKKKEALYMYEKYLGAENIDSELAKTAEQKVLELGERYY